ncbi:MAG: amino acid adenylation domain-containing protein [Betaproteobacteria bacterium]
MTNNFQSSPRATATTEEPTGLRDTGAPGVTEAYELSPLQAGMLFHAVDGRIPGVDIEQIVIVLREPLDDRRFERAWRRVVERHAILRTRFRWSGASHPFQEVLDRVSLPVRRRDWTGLTAAQCTDRFHDLLTEDRLEGFDLDSAPLLRLTLVRVAEAEHWVLWTFHHALLDGRSFALVLHEVFAMYEAYAEDREASLSDPRPFREYIEWLRALDHDSARQYWQQALAGFRAPTPLVIARDRELRDIPGKAWGTHEIRCSRELTAALSALARETSVTLNTVLQGAWAVLLHRYSGERDIVYGSTRACRKSALGGADDMIGIFINTLPIRVHADPEMTIAALLRELRRQQLVLRDYEHTPLTKVQSWSEVPRGTPLFETLLVYEHHTLDAQMQSSRHDSAPRHFYYYYGQTNFPLTVAAYGGEEMLVQLQYSRCRFEDAAAARMLGHLHALLQSLARSPHAKLKDLSLLAPEERRQLLAGSGRAEHHAPGRCLHERFEQAAALTPDAVAVACENVSLSYASLNRQANRVAHRLRTLGVKPDELVGLRVERGLEMVVGILGILKSGAAYLPLDPAYPRARVAYMLEDSGVSVVLTQKSLAPDLEASGARLLFLDEPICAPDADPAPVSKPENLAYVIYTSGSTGNPKGVQITHYNVARLFDATQAWYGFDRNDVWTLFHSYAFDFSVWELWGALLYGGRVVIAPYLVSRSPEAFRELLVRERVTVLNQTPSAFRQLIQADLSAPKADLALRYVIFGGEALELQTLRPWFERYGDERPLLVNMYGITETTVHVTYRPIRMADLDAGWGSVIGEPIPDLRLYLLDGSGEPVPIGVPGEIHVGGAGVARGYLNRPELTAQRFIPDRRSGIADAKLYRTGDLARRLENGDVEYLGRIDHQVKIRGFRIELGEIEAGIARHPAIREVCVIAREDVPGDKRLVAYLAALAATPDLVIELRELIRKTMPEYMVPAHFVTLDALPLTENGKVDRKALPPPGKDAVTAAEYVAPRSAIEKRIAEIWSAVLGVDRIGIDDNFFELGGDSILTIQVIARCRQAGLRLAAKDLFSRPTIARLAEVAAQDASRQDEAHDDRSGPVPLTPIQRWFFEADIEERHYWNQAFLFGVPRDLDLDVLERAFNEVVQRHDALRLRVRRSGGDWSQECIAEHPPLEVMRYDLSDSAPEERTALLERHAMRIQSSLDLERGPLVRMAHFSLGSGERDRLLLAIHHLAVDGVSWRILREELEVAYRCHKEGRRRDYPPRTTTFRRWAQRLTTYARSDDVRRSLDYWVAEAGKPVTLLPLEGHGGANLEGEAATVVRKLQREETRALLHQAPRAYRTQINDALLAALGLALQPWSGGSAFRIDLEGHGREELFDGIDVSGTVGWFTSLFPVRLELAPDPDPGSALKSVKEQLRRIPHRGLSYGLLRYCGDPESGTALAQAPSADLLFNYLGQLDQVVAGSALFTFAEESVGPWHSPRARRSHALEVLCLVRDGEFEVRCTYHPQCQGAHTIEGLAQRFIDALRAITLHCVAAGAGGRTPSDFPLAALGQAALDELWRRYPGLEDVYPLSPIQRLYHVMEGSQAAVGLEPWHFRIEGEIDAARLRKAVEAVAHRHPMLRTAFVSPGDTTVVQVVLPRVTVPWSEEDWRALTPAQQQARLEEAKRAQERAAFDLGQPPLLRVALLRTDDTTWHLLWTTHRLCIDGWSWPLVFRDISHAYEALESGSAPQLTRPGIYRDYIAWLNSGAPDSAAFWREMLAGFTTPTPVSIEPNAAGAGAPAPCEASAALDAQNTIRLQALARSHQFTLSTLVQAAWALLLSHYSASSDVVFGATFSGRSEEVAGIDSLVGPCVSNLPVRVQVDANEPLPAWLARLQANHFKLSQHQYVSPEAIQAWSEVPWRRRLFDSLIVFQNYQVDEAARRLGRGARLIPVSTPESTNYPLTIAVTPASELSLRIIWQPSALSRSAAITCVADLLTVLRAMAQQPAVTVGTILAQLPRSSHGAAARHASSKVSESRVPYAPPRTDMEQAVAALWQELLGVERVSMDDNFFDLGGHSLLLIQAHGRLRDILQRDLPIVSLLQYPTVRTLARHMSGDSDASRGVAGAAERARKQREVMRKQRMGAGMR